MAGLNRIRFYDALSLILHTTAGLDTLSHPSMIVVEMAAGDYVVSPEGEAQRPVVWKAVGGEVHLR